MIPLQKGAAPTRDAKTAWPRCLKGLDALGNHGAKLMRRKSQTLNRGGDGKSCGWWWRPGMGISCFGRGPCTSCLQKHSCHETLCVPSAGWFSQGFMRFVMTAWFVAIYCPAGLSSLFISRGSHCTAVNHCKADSFVSNHKFKCWKKRFVYSYASVLWMWLFIELCVPLGVRMMFGKSNGNLNSVRNL